MNSKIVPALIAALVAAAALAIGACGDDEDSSGTHDGLGLTAEEAGMTHDESDNEKLRTADPFDREFVDMMAPHHAGAVRMAKVVLTKTKNAELRTLAENIVKTQEAEIRTMDSFRQREYGKGVETAPGEHGGGAAQEEPEEHGGGHSG